MSAVLTVPAHKKRTLIQRFDTMIGFWQEGRWIRNKLCGKPEGKSVECYCALGAINKVGRDFLINEALKQAIPKDELERLHKIRDGGKRRLDYNAVLDPETGGNIYWDSDIASFSNTRKSARELVVWFEDAQKILEEAKTT